MALENKTADEWSMTCSWAHPKYFKECPFCELTRLRTKLAEVEEQNKWAHEKLAQIRVDFGNAPFTTTDMEKIVSVVGHEKFNATPSPKGEGVWTDGREGE
jgi:hypothetical protein